MKSEPNRLSSELTMRTDSGDEATLGSLPPAVMQALYHEITGKKENLKRSFYGDYIVDSDAICDLTFKVEQTLRQFNCSGMNVEYVIFHSDNERQICSSLEKFRQYDPSRSKSVKSISIVFEFLISVPDYNKFNSYKLDIDILSYNVDEDDNYGSFGIYKHNTRKAPIDVSIDYIDYVVARTVSQSAEDWINSLHTEKLFKVSDRFDVYAEHLFRPLSWISALSLISFFIISFNFGSGISILSVIFWLGILLFSQSVIATAIDRSYYMIGARNFFPFIKMNRGDDRRIDSFRQRRRRGQRIGSFILITCALPIALGVVSAFLINLL